MMRLASLLRIRLLVLVTVVALCGIAQAQFNIDMNSEFSPPELGGGTPSITFGAAGNQPGFWNAIPAQGNPPLPLRDLSGQLTSVMIEGPHGGIGSGFANTLNTGDFRALLNDGHQVGQDSWTFTGLADGLYHVFTYAILPNQTGYPTFITVTGSLTENPQMVQGLMPGNQFIQGVTHSIHLVEVTDGTLVIQANGSSQHAGFVNGFQIVPVPEPTALLGLAVGSGALTRRRRRVA